jgi:hypothetical protein
MEAELEEVVPESKPDMVTLYPVPGAWIPGEPAVIREVTPKQAKALLRWKPAAFTTEAPPQPESQE